MHRDPPSGATATTEITVTVLAGLRVVFQGPLEDDNVRNDPDTDTDVSNKFKSGSTVPHKVRLYSCGGTDVTAALGSSVTVKLNVTERSQITNALVADVPETYSGEGGPGGLMSYCGGLFQYNLKTNGYEAGTTNNLRYFRSLVKVSYNTHPTVTSGREDARLESK